jgi:multicomponent Na+:H+ antiporter subunit F
MYLFLLLTLILSTLLLLVRFIQGPSIFDRLLCLNSINAIMVALICLVGAFGGYYYYIDVALTYSLIGFIANIVIAKYYKKDNNASTNS